MSDGIAALSDEPNPGLRRLQSFVCGMFFAQFFLYPYAMFIKMPFIPSIHGHLVKKTQ